MKGVLKDLTNQQFGKWLVLNRDTERQAAQAYWNCKCLKNWKIYLYRKN